MLKAEGLCESVVLKSANEDFKASGPDAVGGEEVKGVPQITSLTSLS